ncbi:HDOD domain protein [Treponema pallidum subsp. endemicum]|uniref:HDOD domain-containing protein n=1 Tax=Treponema pallidum TaxID=160 RepID=UPI001020D1C2|nr:HDOD domain protein [Treponema pallidum subsp. endemicum]
MHFARVVKSIHSVYSLPMCDTQIVVDTEKIRKAIELQLPIAITTYTLPRDMDIYIGQVAKTILDLIGQPHVKDYLTYCISELTTNAKKANTKRIYFREKGLDIFDPQDYKRGMKSFKEESLENINHYLKLQQQEGLYVKVTMQVLSHALVIEVINNCKMTPMEFKRVFDKRVRARRYSGLEEALAHILDNSEGAGLGLVIMMLMLKKLGLEEDVYRLVVEEDRTISRMVVPRNIEIQTQTTKLAASIADRIDDIPQLPSKLLEIQRAIENPDVQLSDIVALISQDVALVTDLLKLVNSARFGMNKRCLDISEAVKRVGLRELQNLLYSVGAGRVLQSTDDERKQLWNQAYRTGYFALGLAKATGDQALIADSYICGLLHNLGEVVFTSAYPEMLIKLTEIQAERNIPPHVLDTIMSDVGHAEIGAALAQRWNLPEPVINTIRFHHNLPHAPEEYKPLISTVAFANMTIRFLDGETPYEQIPRSLLSFFRIQSEQQLRTTAQTLQSSFEAEQTA